MAEGENKYYVKLYSARNEAESGFTVHGEKRQDYWSWEKFHMSVAFLAAQRSKDPNTKVGACIVNKSNKIVSVGHNALPESRGWDQKDFPHWDKRDVETCGFENTKYAHVCNAAINAILNKNAENTAECVLYTTIFPGHEDAKLIIQAGISKVVYFEDEYPCFQFTVIAEKLFDIAKVEIKKYNNDKYSIAMSCDSEQKPKIDVFPLPSTSISGKTCPERIDFLTDEDFFMNMACLAARRSKDPSRQVGACIVDKDNKIVGVGYNGFPHRVSDDHPDMNWGKEGDNPSEKKYPYVVHAEVNAIMHKTCIDLKGCRMYVTLFPCNECAKVIVQAGIEVIYYLMDDHHDKIYTRASRQLLERAGYEIIPDLNDEPVSGKKICKCYIPTKRCAIPDILD